MRIQELPGFRRLPLDGAALWFHRGSGTNIRIESEDTRGMRGAAPRTVLFGITNRCNLACSFCSRDRAAPSVWSTESAFELLRDLSERGVLEVAFGGGEPLAFPRFDGLVQRLHQETGLAIHLTTNGTLLSERRLDALLPHVGELRLSLYHDNAWRERVRLLTASGARFGANVLVTADRVATLPALLSELEQLGCPDVALLRYVGDDRALHLTKQHEALLEHAVLHCGMRVRLSVCFNDMLAGVPRMFQRGDCGAGSEFVVITSDGRLKPCSFHAGGQKIGSADDVIAGWAATRHARTRPGHEGCARPLAERAATEGVHVWQGFSANNSGDCVLVGRFERVEDARAFWAELAPMLEPGAPYTPELVQRLVAARLPVSEHSLAPDVAFTAGRAVMLHTDMSLDDDFPELRALLWQRGGVAVYNGVHEHGTVRLVAGLGFQHEADLLAAEVDLGVAERAAPHRRGLDLLTTEAANPYHVHLHDDLTGLEEIARRRNAVFSAELVAVDEDDEDLPHSLAMRLSGDERYRLFMSFPDAARAQAFSRSLDCKHTCADRYLLAEPRRMRPRYGALAHRHGGLTTAVQGDTLRFVLTMSAAEGAGAMTAAQLIAPLRAALSSPAEVRLKDPWSSHVVGWVDTREPGQALSEIVSFARTHGQNLWLSAQPPDVLAQAIARVTSDLHVLRKRR